MGALTWLQMESDLAEAGVTLVSVAVIGWARLFILTFRSTFAFIAQDNLIDRIWTDENGRKILSV